MLDEVTFEQQTESALYLRLKDPSKLETGVLTRMEKDEYALGCMVVDEQNALLMYSVQNLIPLSSFFREYTFCRQEGYLFLISLLEKAIAVNRSKPVLLNTDFIYVSSHGDEAYFTVVPLQLEYWMFQKEECLALVQEILDQMKVKQAYELPGYLVECMKTDAFSLPSLINGLRDLMTLYYPKRLFHRQITKFRAGQPVHPSIYDPTDLLSARSSQTSFTDLAVKQNSSREIQKAESFVRTGSQLNPSDLSNSCSRQPVESGRTFLGSVISENRRDGDSEVLPSSLDIPTQSVQELLKETSAAASPAQQKEGTIPSVIETSARTSFYRLPVQHTLPESRMTLDADPLQRFMLQDAPGCSQDTAVFSGKGYPYEKTAVLQDSESTVRKQPAADLFSGSSRLKPAFLDPELSTCTLPAAQLQRAESCREVFLSEQEYGWIEIGDRQYSLQFETVSIGRHPSNDICLTSQQVSGYHARIIRQQGRYYIQDLKSMNSTYLFNKKVIRKMRLRDGMLIRFGDVKGIFHEPAV